MGRSVDKYAKLASTTSVVSRFSEGGYSLTTGILVTAKSLFSGPLTANTLRPILSIAGTAGSLLLGTYLTTDATGRTLRLKVTVDNVVVFDATTDTILAPYKGLACCGAQDVNSSQMTHADLSIRFNSSLLVEIASSLTEYDKSIFYYMYVLD